MQMKTKTSYQMVSMQPRNHYKNSTMQAKTTMKAQISNQHDKNAIMGDDECLRQGLYL